MSIFLYSLQLVTHTVTVESNVRLPMGLELLNGMHFHHVSKNSEEFLLHCKHTCVSINNTDIFTAAEIFSQTL
jgi:hypothetical protein